MYQERKFDTWKEGLIYLVIIIAIPLIPVIIYMKTKEPKDNYLYILLLSVIFSFCYEFIRANNNCSTFLKLENIICCVVLAGMFICDFYLMVYYAETSKDKLVKADYILVFLFLVPVISTIVEIFRAVIADINANKNKAQQNIVDGASGT